ncbi:MucR family transcriptional regulator [Methylobacterium sp. ID0610]|uniref:MucR family transcriptional regulator n=1 Tax=Methylobacterium carpenticola TaxID=3344827 RepID=UPI003673BF9B
MATDGLTPEQSRREWGLPADHPIMAANYTATRSEIAKANGLGRTRRPIADPRTVASRSRTRKNAGTGRRPGRRSVGEIRAGDQRTTRTSCSRAPFEALHRVVGAGVPNRPGPGPRRRAAPRR